jgi:ATP phosphoribosyltransferase regulatory subunit
MPVWPVWLLPDHIADLLPSQARRVEELRRRCLDAARGFGYELVMPPLLEYTDSLLAGAGQDLDLLTFKLTDQLSGKTLGVRADMTPQVARIDAHVLNRKSVARFCYAGSVLHSHLSAGASSREHLQFGAEIYGHNGIEADCEVLELALACAAHAGVAADALLLDLNDVRVLKAVLGEAALSASMMEELLTALSAKDRGAVSALCERIALSQSQSKALMTLLDLYGGESVLQEAAQKLPQSPALNAALADLRVLIAHAKRLGCTHMNVDLADSTGFHYYTASSFKLYCTSQASPLVRGGRYDNIGGVFGRARAASGLGLYLTDVAQRDEAKQSTAIRAPWRPEDAALSKAITALRLRGERVVYELPGQADAADEFQIDREMVFADNAWQIKALVSKIS